MNVHTFLIEVGADIESLHRHALPAHRGRKFTKAVEDDKDMKQVSYDHCFIRDQPGMKSAKIMVSNWCRKIEVLAWCLLMWCH